MGALSAKQKSRSIERLFCFRTFLRVALYRLRGLGFWGTLRCNRPGSTDLQVIVFGKVHAKIPRHHVVVTQIAVDDDAFGLANGGGNAPRRVAQMAAGLGATGAKLANHACQTLSPVAGAECLSVQGQTQDKDFFGRVGEARSGFLGKREDF